MTDDAFFARDGEHYIPNPSCRGPWDPNSLHGRVIAGLLGAEIEQRHGAPDLQFSRLTVDLWRLPTFVPISVETRAVREGGRIRVVDAECFAEGVSIGRASGVLLRRGDAPDGEVWQPEPWDMPPPDQIERVRSYFRPDEQSAEVKLFADRWRYRRMQALRNHLPQLLRRELEALERRYAPPTKEAH